MPTTADHTATDAAEPVHPHITALKAEPINL